MVRRRSVIISLKGGKLHFHTIGVLVYDLIMYLMTHIALHMIKTGIFFGRKYKKNYNKLDCFSVGAMKSMQDNDAAADDQAMEFEMLHSMQVKSRSVPPTASPTMDCLDCPGKRLQST